MAILILFLEGIIKVTVSEWLRYRPFDVGARPFKVTFRIAGGYKVRVMGALSITEEVK